MHSWRFNLLDSEISGVFLHQKSIYVTSFNLCQFLVLDFHMWCKNMHMSSMLNRLIIKENRKLTLKMLQIGNEAGKLSPVTRLWSWKKSTIQIVTSPEGDGLKLLMPWAWLNDNLKSGSRTVAWSGRKKIQRAILKAVMVLMTWSWKLKMKHPN